MNTQIKDKVVKKIFSVTIKHEIDTDPDTSWLGEYTDELTDGIIVCRDNQFYEKLPREMERNADGTFTGKGDFIDSLPECGRDYRGFKPYAGGEEVGTKDYYKYGMQDYARMESLNNGQWCFIEIIAEARIGISFDGGHDFKLDTLTSGGIWGIESDSGKEFIADEENNQLAELRRVLLAYGFGRSKVEKAIKEAIREE